jgi:hypothetical protein
MKVIAVPCPTCGVEALLDAAVETRPESKRMNADIACAVCGATFRARARGDQGFVAWFPPATYLDPSASRRAYEAGLPGLKG